VRVREQAERATASNNYWSSTTNANNPTNAWNVNFNNGNVNNNNKNNNNYVRAVRGGLWSALRAVDEGSGCSPHPIQECEGRGAGFSRLGVVEPPVVAGACGRTWRTSKLGATPGAQAPG
jgi:hypothetical protein